MSTQGILILSLIATFVIPALIALAVNGRCWWQGHDIEASIHFDDSNSRFIYHCRRCKRLLPGPEKG